MKRATIICIVGGDKSIRGELYDIFKTKIPKEFLKYKYDGGQLNLPLEPDSPEFFQAMEFANKFSLHPTLFSKIQYTKREIEEMPFFNMIIPDSLELEGTDASDYGTRYKGGCLVCGLGGIPIENVLIDRKLVKKYKIGSVRPNLYVSKEFKEVLESNNLTGVSFNHEMKDYKGRDMPKYYIADIPNILPPMSNSTWLESNGGSRYKECGHQVIYLRSDIQYERDKLKNALDFNLSQEYVDNFRLRVIIVSAKVRKLFMQNKVHAGFFPVAILE